MRISPATPLADLTEAEWQHQIVGTKTNPGVARTLGWKAYHTLRSRGSESGWPDWALVRDRVVYLELKREKTHPSPEQKDWILALMNAGCEVYIARPRDLEPLGRILAYRGGPAHIEPGEIGELARALRESTRTECQ